MDDVEKKIEQLEVEIALAHEMIRSLISHVTKLSDVVMTFGEYVQREQNPQSCVAIYDPDALSQ